MTNEIDEVMAGIRAELESLRTLSERTERRQIEDSTRFGTYMVEIVTQLRELNAKFDVYEQLERRVAELEKRINS